MGVQIFTDQKKCAVSQNVAGTKLHRPKAEGCAISQDTGAQSYIGQRLRDTQSHMTQGAQSYIDQRPRDVQSDRTYGHTATPTKGQEMFKLTGHKGTQLHRLKAKGCAI